MKPVLTPNLLETKRRCPFNYVIINLIEPLLTAAIRAAEPSAAARNVETSGNTVVLYLGRYLQKTTKIRLTYQKLLLMSAQNK